MIGLLHNVEKKVSHSDWIVNDIGVSTDHLYIIWTFKSCLLESSTVLPPTPRLKPIKSNATTVLIHDRDCPGRYSLQTLGS